MKRNEQRVGQHRAPHTECRAAFDLATSIRNELTRAAKEVGVDQIFSSAASPGVISLFFGNEHYGTREEYVFAIAEAMRHEYEAIAAAGATLQLDCPDLAMGRHSAYADMSLKEFRDTIEVNIAALNHAVRNIPVEQLRMHLCWGNYPGPHHHDIPIDDFIDIVWTAKPRTVLFEGFFFNDTATTEIYTLSLHDALPI